MPVIFKPVGNTSSKKVEIHKEILGTLTLTSIHMIFEEYGLNKEELEKIKFLALSQTINEETSIVITNTNDLVVFVFSPVIPVKNKLEEIFNKRNTVIQEIKEMVDPYIQKPIDTVQEDVVPVLDDSIVNTMNEKASKLFENEDFKHLIRIYYSNQDIMKTFFEFIVHGDIVKINIPKPETAGTFEKEITIMRNLGIKESDENIRHCLASFNGHLNLTLRALLCRKAILETSIIADI